MYTQTWNKYLSVIRILLKRAVTGEQTFKLNISDFEKSGPPYKKGSKFTIHFKNGKPANMKDLPVIAKDLVNVLVQDTTINDLFMQNEYEIGMSSKFELSMKFIPRLSEQDAPPLTNGLAK